MHLHMGCFAPFLFRSEMFRANIGAKHDIFIISFYRNSSKICKLILLAIKDMHFNYVCIHLKITMLIVSEAQVHEG